MPRTPQGFQYVTFQPPSTGVDQWYRQEFGKSTGLILKAGTRQVYKLRFLLGQESVREYEGTLYDGLEVVCLFDALEWQFGDTTSIPAALPVEMVVVHLRTALWAATEQHPSIQSVRKIASTSGASLTVGAGLAVAIIDDESDTRFEPGVTWPHQFERRKAFDSWLSGFIVTGGATFEVWLLAWGDVNNPVANEPRTIQNWTAKALTPAAAIHTDTTQFAWTAGAQNVGGTLEQGALRWPQGGGQLVVYNPGGVDINVNYCLSLSSQY